MPDISDPVIFSSQYLGVDLWEAQQALIRAIATEPKVSIKSGHSSGKTYTAACGAIYHAIRYEGALVLILSASWSQVRSVLWQQIHNLLAEAKVTLPTTKVTETELHVGRSRIIGISSNDVLKLQGYHSPHTLIIIDESPGVEESFFVAIQGILASGDTHLVLMGNPTASSGFFFDSFHRNRAQYKTFTLGAFDTPNLAGVSIEQLLKMSPAELNENQRPYLCTRKWTLEMYRDYWSGSVESSPVYAARVLGIFPAAGSRQLYPTDALERAIRPAMDLGGKVIVGCDPSGPGSDFTSCCAMAGTAILEIESFGGRDGSPYEVVAFCGKYERRLEKVRLDSIGVGWFLAPILRERGFRVEPVNVSVPSNEPDKYLNLKAELMWGLRELLRANRISGLDRDTSAEMAGANYLISPTKGVIQIESKEQARSILGHSPDRMDSLTLAVGGVVRAEEWSDAAKEMMEWNAAARKPYKKEPLGERSVSIRNARANRRHRGLGLW